MSANTFNIGDRVQLIPFQHKGKIATVRYFGAIGKKFGTWVGLELDEPTGDNNVEGLFECRDNHGLILRNTQVRAFDPNAPVVARTAPTQTSTVAGNQSSFSGSLSLGDDLSAVIEQKLANSKLNDSPLLTPTQGSFASQSLSMIQQDSQANLLKKVNEQLNNLNSQSFVSKEGADGGENKKKGWHERLERLKQKKAEDKKQQETTAGDDLDAAAQELRASFAPTSGIKKDATGKLIVAQEEVTLKKADGEAILKNIEEEKSQIANLVSQALEQESEVIQIAPPVEKKVPTVTNVKPGHNKTVSNADKIKEKQVKLEEERKLRQSVTGTLGAKAPPSRNSAVVGGKSLNQSLNTQSVTSLAADKKTTSAVTSKTTLNSTQRIATREKEVKEPETPGKGLTRTGSSSRLGLTSKTGQPAEPTTPGLKRENSSSRLGLSDRPQTATSRQGSAVRSTASNLRGVNATGRDGAQTARGNSKDKAPTKELNSTLTKSLVGKTTVTGSATKTGVTERPGSSLKGALAAKVASAVKDASKPSALKTQETIKAMPLDYKKIEALVIEKTTEIDCLKEEIYNLKERISEITNQHESELSNLQEKHSQDLKQQSEQHADEKIQFQTELESITERMMNANPDGGQQSQELMERAQQQLEKIKAEQQNLLKSEQEKYLNLLGELEELKREKQQKQTLISELQDQVQQLQTQMQEQQILHEQEIKTLNERLIESTNMASGDAEKVQQELLRNQSEINAKLQTQFSDYQKSIEASKAQEIASRDQLIKELTKKTMDQSTSLTELEMQRVEENELHQLELAQIKDEKEEILQQLMAHGKVEDEDPLADIGLEEIKIQNKKLRAAITSLTFGFEEERKKLEAALKDETSKDRKIADLEEKIKEMDFLLEEVELKEQERADMQEKLEEIVEYENMVEEMVQEIAKKEEENDEMADRLAECQEEQRLMEELNNQLEQYNKELTEEIEDKDNRIVQLKAEIDQLEVIIVEQDGLGEKYKDRLSEMQKQNRVLTDQLQEYTQDGSKDQVGILLEKQQNLIRQLRKAESTQLQVQRNFVELWQGRAYSELVVQILPLGLQKEAQLESYTKLSQLNTLRHKATLFVREICEKQLDQAIQIYEEKDQLDTFVGLLQRLGHIMNMIINQCVVIQFQMANSSPEQYREITKILVWDRIPVIMSQVDTITDLMNNQSLSYTFETTDFQQEVKSLETLSSKVEKLFSALSPEETKQQEAEGLTPEKMMQSIAYQRRKNLCEHVSKLKLRQSAFSMALGVCFVSFYIKDQSEGRAVSQKCKLIYLRLLDTIMKLDHIANEEDGSDYIDIKQLNTELRLHQKLETISVLWSGPDEEIEEHRQKSWLSTLEAIERDITMLNNDYKFKRLIKLVDQKYGSQKIDFNDLYKLDFQADGPWRSITTSIRTELQDMTALKQKNSILLEKQKESLIQTITLKKEKDEAQLISQQLDSKLSLALAKAEQVPALEIENKDQEKKIQQAQKQVETIKAEVEKNKLVITDLTKRLEEAKKIQAAAPPPEQLQQQQQVQNSQSQGSRPNIRARPSTKHHSRSSRVSNFYDNLRMSTGLVNKPDASAHNRTQSQYNTAQVLQQMQQTEDVYMQIISELQYDRLRLKAKDMTQRIAKLSAESTAFCSLLKQFGQVEVRLNQDESNLVQGAIKEVQKLKVGYKKRLAQARVIDLTKPKTTQETQQEQFNQQVIRAKDVVDETLNLLFSKDTKFKTESKPITDPVIETKTEAEQPKNTSLLSEIKIGEIKLRGKVQLPTRKVILDERQLVDMRRNLTLFTC